MLIKQEHNSLSRAWQQIGCDKWIMVAEMLCSGFAATLRDWVTGWLAGGLSWSSPRLPTHEEVPNHNE